MASNSFLTSFDRFLAQFAEIAHELHMQAQCARWGLSLGTFAESLRRSAEKRFADAPTGPREVVAYLRSLHLEDLALACACSAGIEIAWEFFIRHFRQDLRRAAIAMLRGAGLADEARAAELADSLYVELYGIRSGRESRRKSLFEYFHGRSKLSTWLRAVLAQKQVDLLRAGSGMVSLDAELADGRPDDSVGDTEGTPADPDRERYLRRIDEALSAGLASLASRERLILACYYVDRLTLAEIGRMLREHESTVSRQLERTRQALRESVIKTLQHPAPAIDGHPAEAALDAAEMELAFEYATEDWAFDLSGALSAAEISAGRARKRKEESLGRGMQDLDG
jgi:RNA polymerase sigma-70 factor